MKENTRRKLLKRLALIAAVGYVAPVVIRIDTSPAHAVPKCSNPPCT